MIQDLASQPIAQYIVQLASECHGGTARLPPLDKLAEQLGISRGKLREDLLTAQAYGLVEMRPGDGTYVRPFDFYSALRPLVLYSVAQDKRTFDQYYRVRACLEVAFWDQAVAALNAEDHEELEGILQDAERKLRGTPIEIPHKEHRKLHTLLFSKLANPFVRGIVRAYWDAYEAAGLHRYLDLQYYERMWSSHRSIVQAVASGKHQEGKEILRVHFTLLEDRLQDSRHA